MLRAQLAVESTSLDLGDIAGVMGAPPTEGRDRGDPLIVNPLRPRGRSTWILEIDLDPTVHLGTEALSDALEALDPGLADRAAELRRMGAGVTLSLIQELNAGDEGTFGLMLSADAVAWLARATATLSVDQYIEA